MSINLLDYDRQQHNVPLKEITYDAHIAQEELAKAWLRENVKPLVVETDPSTWELAPNIHYCPGHALLWREFRDSGGVKQELENVVPYKSGKDDHA